MRLFDSSSPFPAHHNDRCSATAHHNDRCSATAHHNDHNDDCSATTAYHCGCSELLADDRRRKLLRAG